MPEAGDLEMTRAVPLKLLKLDESKRGLPILRCVFGTGEPVYINYALSEGWQISDAVNFLKSLVTNEDRRKLDIFFDGYEQFENLFADLEAFIKCRQYKYFIRSWKEKGLPCFEVSLKEDA